MSYFGDLNDETLDVSILKRQKSEAMPAKGKVKSADALFKTAESQGWSSREPKKPGPKRRESRTVLTMNGPNRVLDAFRAYAYDLEVSQWKALEHMMKELKIL